MINQNDKSDLIVVVLNETAVEVMALVIGGPGF